MRLNRDSKPLSEFSDTLASVLPDVDSHAEHSRWKPGIGPFEEENQIEMLIDSLDAGSLNYTIETEQSYPNEGLRCDVMLESNNVEIPIEAKLLRFRYDNGNIDPASYARVFSPFPERTSSSLLTDAKKLYESDFTPSGGLLGLYYEEEKEVYDEMTADAIAEKFRRDVGYWYDFQVDIANIARFEGLQHPHHQHGAVIAWRILD